MKKKEDDDKSINVHERAYTSYEIYNYKRGATTIHPRRH